MGHANYELYNLQQWQEYLLALHPKEIDLGLERVQIVYERLNINSPAIKIVVGGTNGKGSTCALLEAILLAAGYRVGVYSSPHLVAFNERFRINGKLPEDAELCAHLSAVEAQRGTTSLTFFEHTTLAALHLFAQSQLDVWLLEVGLGGRLDAVNVIDGDCSVLTQIDVDHQDYLGADREQIGAEKAAIFRSGRPAICADPNPPQSILDYAKQIQAPLWVMDRDFSVHADMQQWQYRGPIRRRSALPYPALRGANQLPNAATALAVLDALSDRLVVPMQDIKQGLLNVHLEGRFQIVPGQPTVILDVGHNPHALRSLAYNLQQIPTTGRTIAVLGMLKDKEVVHALRPLIHEIDLWLCASIAGPRGLDAQLLSSFVKQAYTAAENLAINPSTHVISSRPTVRPRTAPTQPKSPEIQCFDSVTQAFQAAQRLSTVNDKIVVFGSFMTVGPVLAQIKAG